MFETLFFSWLITSVVCLCIVIVFYFQREAAKKRADKAYKDLVDYLEKAKNATNPVQYQKEDR